jgi:hypothetical protein
MAQGFTNSPIVFDHRDTAHRREALPHFVGNRK